MFISTRILRLAIIAHFPIQNSLYLNCSQVTVIQNHSGLSGNSLIRNEMHHFFIWSGLAALISAYQISQIDHYNVFFLGPQSNLLFEFCWILWVPLVCWNVFQWLFPIWVGRCELFWERRKVRMKIPCIKSFPSSHNISKASKSS